MKARTSGEQVDHLVLVIHGVGDPAPGETLSLFARSVAAANQPLAEAQDVIWLDEKSSCPEYVQRFATHVRQLDVGGRHATLAEVYWGDLSRVRQGVLGAVLGLIEIVFGLQYVAFAAAWQKGRAVEALRYLGRTAAGIVHGPALAVTFFLALLTFALVCTELLWQESWRGTFATQLLVAIVCTIAMVASGIGQRLTRHHVVEQFWYWVQVTALFVSGLMFLKLLWLDRMVPELVWHDEVRNGLIWYCRVLVWMLALLWLAQMLVVLGMAIAWGISQFTCGRMRWATHSAFLIPTLVVGFWGLLLPMLWLVASKSLESATAKFRSAALSSPLGTIGSASRGPAPGTVASATAIAAVAGGANSPVAIPSLPADGSAAGVTSIADRASSPVAEPGMKVMREFEQLFEQAAPMVGVQLTMAGVIVAMAGVTLMRYAAWRSSWFWRSSGLEQGGEPPRLIVHEWVTFSAGLCTTVGVSLIAFLNIQQMRGIDYLHHPAGRILAEANKVAIGLLLPLGIFSCMLFPHLRPVIDIVLDVVNHFFFRPTTLNDAIDSDEFDIREATFDNGRQYFARRDAIHVRIKNALAYFRDHLSGKPALTLISHSQGTMIAIEVLNDPELAWLSRHFSEVRLVTMGSPFSHLYQHYFPNLYPPLDDPHWQELHARLKRWINICRRDDFVGTLIRFPESIGVVPQPLCTNHAVGPRGHLNYWSDVEVLDILRRELLDDGEAVWTREEKVRRAA